MRRTGIAPALVLCCAVAGAAEWRAGGTLAVQGRDFRHGAEFTPYRRSGSLDGALRLERPGAVAIVLRAEATVDADDERRSRLEVLEAAVDGDAGPVRVTAGVQQIRWGVMDLFSPVDLVNQTDLSYDLWGSRRLGLPALRLRGAVGPVGLDGFFAGGFRPRPFPGAGGRLRFPVPVSDREQLRSGAGRGRGEGGLRADARLGPAEIALSWFSGYARDPIYELAPGGEALLPVYDVIDQVGATARWTSGRVLARAEVFRRGGQQGGYAGAAAGLEASWRPGRSLLSGAVEGWWDGRDGRAVPGSLEHDVAVTGRALFPAAGDARVEATWIRDLRVPEHVLRLRADRRLGRAWRVAAEVVVTDTPEPAAPGRAAWPALALDPDRKFAFLDAEDHVVLRLERHF